ncbi:outer membrane beta-barrel protein, partial [Flavobacterium sp.]|uniref:outer membrane beta-barrel protein n=1 Tax=Flavobacterium sp. TaxID=239 RepID=UPI004048AE17
INDNESIKVKFKNSIVEVNGNQLQLSGFELENYLKALDPKTIKRIEIISNPNASYGSDIEAVINIITNQNSNNYRIGSNLTNGTREKYFNSSNINLNYNLKKVKLYSSYSYNFNQKVNESNVTSQIENSPVLKFNYNEDTSQKNHQYYVNFNYEINKNNNIDFTSISSFDDFYRDGFGKNSSFERVLESTSGNEKIQFAEIYNHSFNDSTFLKIGSYQVFNNSKSSNYASTNSTNIENQNQYSKIPLIVGFGDFNKATLIGAFNVGVRFNYTSIDKDNFSINNNIETNSPYNYDEKIFSSYINNSFNISENTSISLGIRLESSFIDYRFSDVINIAPLLSEKLKYSNLLYNINYMYSSNKEWHHSIAFRKQIQRPNYSYLNPFQNINSDVTYFSGDTKIVPSKIYSFSYEVLKKDWSFYIQAGTINDFISTFTTL